MYFENHPRAAWLVFAMLLLLCSIYGHAAGTPAAACSTLGGGAGACYVDCFSGSNGNAGSIDAPWRTPLEIGLHAFAAGDKILLRRDCTWRDGLLLSPLGGWTASTQYSQNSYIVPASANGHYYQETAAGPCTSYSSTPTFPTNGTSVSDNNCTWLDEGTGIPNNGNSSHSIIIESYGGNGPFGSGKPPHLTGLLPLPAIAWSAVSGATNIWQSAPLYVGTPGCASGSACVDCPTAGTHYSCLDLPANVINFVQFGNPGGAGYVWGNQFGSLAALEANTFCSGTSPCLGDWYFDSGTFAVNQVSIASDVVTLYLNFPLTSAQQTALNGQTIKLGSFGAPYTGSGWTSTTLLNGLSETVTGVTANTITFTYSTSDISLTGATGSFALATPANDTGYQRLFVYSPSNPTTYYGQVAPIAISNAQIPANGGSVMLQLGSATGALSYIHVQHLQIDWFDGIGVQIPYDANASGDHIYFANMASDSLVENGLFRDNYSGAVCPSQTYITASGYCEQYTQIGFYISTSGTPSDIHIWNTDAIGNYVGYKFANGTGQPCSACVIDLKNNRSYANRTYGIQDNLGGAAAFDYSHLFANNLATGLETDVQMNFNAPSGGFSCAGTPGVVTMTWTNGGSPTGLIAGEFLSVSTKGSGTGAGTLTHSGFATNYVINSTSTSGGAVTVLLGQNPANASWACPASSDSGGAITVSSGNKGTHNLAFADLANESTSNFYGNLVSPFVKEWRRFPAYVSFTYDDPGLVPYSDEFVNQLLPIATRLGTNGTNCGPSNVACYNYSIAVVTGSDYSGDAQSGPLAGIIPRVQDSWIDAGWDVVTHSVSHEYWAPPAANCGDDSGASLYSASATTVPCHALINLQYIGGLATTVSLTITHASGAPTLTLSPSPYSADPAAYHCWDLTPIPPGQNAYIPPSGCAEIGTLGAIVSTLVSSGKYTVSVDSLAKGDAHAWGLNDVTISDVKASPVKLDFLENYLETDEMQWAGSWMNYFMTGMPTNRIYVMPSSYGDPQTETIAQSLGYTGVRGTASLKPCCAANTTLANGYNVFNILSQGSVPSLQNLSYAGMRNVMAADAFKNALWGRPIGFFQHINELNPDLVQNEFDGAMQAGATVISETKLMNLLRSCNENDQMPPVGTGYTGSYTGNTFYACPGTGYALDFRPTANSPTNGAGVTEASPFNYDLMGNLRSTWDMGAYSYIPMSTGTVGCVYNASTNPNCL
jgi:hypothetical protein